MRLQLYAKSQKGYAYVPDWIQCYVENPDDPDEYILLTMDIAGTTNYDKPDLDCQTKGELVPWTYWDEDEEYDLSDLTAEQAEPYLLAFNKALENADDIRIGISPINNYPDYTLDRFSGGEGTYEFKDENGHYQTIDFSFDCETYEE